MCVCARARVCESVICMCVCAYICVCVFMWCLFGVVGVYKMCVYL